MLICCVYHVYLSYTISLYWPSVFAGQTLASRWSRRPWGSWERSTRRWLEKSLHLRKAKFFAVADSIWHQVSAEECEEHWQKQFDSSAKTCSHAFWKVRNPRWYAADDELLSISSGKTDGVGCTSFGLHFRATARTRWEGWSARLGSGGKPTTSSQVCATTLSMDELFCTLQLFRVCPECLDFGGVCPDQWRSEERAARQDAGWFSKFLWSG